MARNVAVNKSALAKARERRRELDHERDAKDQRIEEATALTIVALEGLADAEVARDAAAAEAGAAVRTLMAEDVSAERAAALLDVDVRKVRSLAKAATRPPGTPRQRAETTSVRDRSVASPK